MREVFHSFFKFQVAETHKIGRGCFATSNFLADEIICKFTGPKMSLKDFVEKYDLSNGNPLQIDKDTFLDLIEPYIFFNHSCDPNAGLRNDGVLFALRDIKKGTEITYDYSTTIDDVTWSMNCLCGSSECRKIIGDFMSIPHLKKIEYFKKGCLLKHIKELYF